ncbi:Glutathione S-transferase GstA [Bosea sp. 62]|uniref:glutathione transferase GstA n=1 Tax=unclassified Bosea (in: a-proteobacteria) TaxID=2653178 RepID=UPI00125A9EBA|nr:MULTISPECIES: glutathione transferase GstA [unclassified Bosea (in: a-proteobacteria)]CAD5246217.1 Glutathione S-transferase GstA [Bosea sp. 7B]CAD5247585.1 Glutathione S-transferase GstA [Bosea sp. 21B]CAD5270069.1 Glutathione S-transferase GstA [Bosea sp. 46]VVT50946.1 Glutathione S-transferase GstA [Bosea sp. EC-HK365B]VXA94359.1 Glutathione S-transferase GstA [Bosea sp. 127]
MKLYYAPGACSLSPHIALREAGLPVTLEKVDLLAGRTETGADYAAVSPKGYVPALQFDDGTVLTEGAVIARYIADLAPDAALAPKPGSFERIRLEEIMNFIGSELHKAYTPLFLPDTSEDGKTAARARVAKKLGYIENILADGRSHLLGEHFTVADGYLFTIVNWSDSRSVPLDAFPKLRAFMARIGARASVQEAMRAEGLLQ